MKKSTAGKHMQKRELRKLSRKELLEILVEQQKIIEKLELKINEYEENEEKNRIAIDNADSIAAAMTSLNDVLGNAQKVADQYLYEIKLRALQQAQRERDSIIEDARKKASAIVSNAEALRTKETREFNSYAEGDNQKVIDYLNSHPELDEYLGNNNSAK